MTRLELEVPIPLPSTANLTKEHPMARAERVATVHNLVGTALAKQSIQQCQLLSATAGQVLIVRLYRLGAAELDDDNLASSLKAARDAVAHWLGVDDRLHLRVRYFVYQARRPKVFIAKTGRQRKDRRYETLRIEAFPIAVRPPLGVDLEQLKLNAEIASMLFDAAEDAAKNVRAAGDVEAALGSWLGIDPSEDVTTTP